MNEFEKIENEIKYLKKEFEKMDELLKKMKSKPVFCNDCKYKGMWFGASSVNTWKCLLKANRKYNYMGEVYFENVENCSEKNKNVDCKDYIKKSWWE